ncbi:uncharacterized protein LOC143177709 isoform X2 [Calliopsis andreniformis]|uniref:uncharacterized protein LOC143177709 isoform X2 n=1 Tax=Calliopsis andreniformis TaxID=337506 RepID=UPI003FCE2E2C
MSNNGTICISKWSEDPLDRLRLYWYIHRIPILEKTRTSGYRRRFRRSVQDGAGKTSIINQICVANGDENSYIVPPKSTQGSCIYRIKHGSYFYNVWDIGGADSTRKYWTAFLQDTDLLLFVVDASDPSKLSLAASTLKHLLDDARMDTVPILVIANKQDCPNALRPEEIKKALDLLSISPHKHKVDIIGCQTRPLPENPAERTEYTWHHPSMDIVRKKIFSMVT